MLAACALLEWSRRRNVKGVAVPALVTEHQMTPFDSMAIKMGPMMKQ